VFESIARFSVRFRWLIIVVWIAAVPISSHYLPSLSSVSNNDNSAFLPKDSPTARAAALETKFSGKGTSTQTVIAVSRDSQKLKDSDEVVVNALITDIKKNGAVTKVQDLGKSSDGQAQEILVGLGQQAAGPQGTQLVTDLRSTIHKHSAPGLKINLTGEFALAIDAQSANTNGKNNTQSYTILLIVVLLLIVFRALLAPIVTLIPAALALLIAQPLIAESTKIGVQVSFITEILLIVLILGAGTDYGLFLVFRTREELRKGLAPKDAVVKALSKVGESITFSAATVASALLCLLLASFGIYKGLGPSLAIGLGVMLLAALTFLPALLAILGRAVFWPSKTVKTPLKIGLWGRVADKVIERPVLMLVAGVIVFAGLSLGIIGYKTAGFSSGESPKNSDSAIGQRVLAKHYPAANNNPQYLFMTFNDPVWNNLGAVAKAQTELANSPNFSAVGGPFSANGFAVTPEQLSALHKAGGNNPILTAVSQFISPDGKTVKLYGISNAGTSGSVAAANATPALRDRLDKVARDVGASGTEIYGQDAAVYDISRIANSDLKKIIPIVLIIIAVLLAIMLRSLVAPWYLIATVGLSYVAALGFAMIVFVHIGGADGLNFILPFMMFIFSMALGEDYNILVMSRIREEARGNLSLKKAVAKSVGITGTTVTSAGLILAGTFTVLGLVGGDEQLRQIGFSIAFGILLDTFFVRTLLVPSIVALLGRWNWWPSKLSKST
jgi:RND superfamily putative drug exporter